MAGRGALVTFGRIGVEPRVAHGPSNQWFGRTNMANRDHIRHPLEWGADQLTSAEQALERAGHSLRSHAETRDAPVPAVRKIELADLADVLASGVRDFGAYRSDVIFLCIIYPLAGLVLARLAFGYDMLPLLFPLASGFALIGPVAAVGLYEMSRRREQGVDINWADAFGVVRAPAFGAILMLGLLLLAIFLLWLAAAYAIYLVTLGPEPPASIGTFIRDVLVNPVPMAAWGLIVAGGLVIGSIPVLLGLIIVMPVLGHATWHLYRKVVPR